jgi:uncharacterized membrane protein YebE (DUF533 family)
MMDTGKLIGQLLQSGMARSAGTRMQSAAQNQSGLGSLLGDLLGGGGSSGRGAGGLSGLLGGGAGSSRSGGAGGLAGLTEMAGQYLGQAKGAAARNPKLAAGGAGAVLGSLFGGGKVTSGLGGAAIGVIGMIAMNALRNSGQAGPDAQAPTQPAGPGPVAPEDVPVPEETTQRLILMAMISAAKADGHIDEREMAAIVGKLKEDGADGEERDWVLRELGKPLDLDTLVAAVPGLEVAAQVYAASVLAITADTPQEVAYLDQLANKLGLQPAVRSYIHQSLGMPLTT